MTRICIFGAGAIGGYVGARLAMAGEADVSLVARGPHLAAMQQHGLILKQDGETRVLHPEVTDDPRQLGPQDFIILTLKAHAITGVIEALQPLVGPHTAILFAQNGIPWWYFYKSGGPFDGHRLRERRSRRRDLGPHRAGTRAWLRRLAGSRDRGAGRHLPPLWRPHADRRTVRREDRTRSDAEPSPDGGRHQEPDQAEPAQ